MKFTKELNRLARTEESVALRKHYDFGVADKQGRVMGCVTHAYRQIFRDALPGEETGWLAYHTAGTVYVGRCHVTRDGEKFGGSYSFRKFATAAARDRWLEEKVAAARKRAAAL